jgi:hypothetical protein
MSGLVVIDPLDDADAIRRQVSLLAKTKYIDPGASPDGGEKNLKRAGGAGDGRLVGGNREVPKMGIHPRSSREVNDHFHILCLHKK